METTTLDDRSPNITYSGIWSIGGVPGKEFNGTTTYTVSAGSTATIHFFGSQISVFGTISRPDIAGATTNSSYSIDNGSPVFVSWGLPARIEYQQLYFQSSRLSPTSNHTLIIADLGLNGKLILDFINITGSATNTGATTAPAVLGNSPIKHLPVRKIVGGVVGGIFAAVVTIIVVGVIFLKRKKNHEHQRVERFPFAHTSTLEHDCETKRFPTNMRGVAQEIFLGPPLAYT